MTILEVVADVAKVVGLAVPTTVYGSVDRTEQELGALANEVAQRIAHDGHDWTRLKTLATITGDASTTEFALPDDYRRFLKDGAIYLSSMPANPLYHVTDSNEWLNYEVQQFSTITNRWIILGADISIKPAPAAAVTGKYMYITKNIVHPATGSNKTAFTIDTDEYLLDERVLKLGMIWQWLANKGRPYSEHMENYETALAARTGEDKGPAIKVVGTRRIPSDVTVAYPGFIIG